MPMPDDADPVADLEAALDDCLLGDRVHIGRRLKDLRSAPSGGSHGSQSRELDRLRERVEASRRLRSERLRLIPAVSYPEELPITARKEEILRAIAGHQVIVVAGETGSGKTTQLPKICLEAGRGRDARIVCTQPRRVAALSLSRRLAEELGVTWGREVGCKIRFRDRTASETLIKLVTDGMLLSEIRGDPDLLEYDTVILDEAHERSLNIDFLLGYLRLLLKKRPGLKLVITSATIDVEKFSRAFGGAPVVEVSGRMYPVEVRYRPLEEILGEGEELSYTDAAVAEVQQLLDESPSGDILVFMPGERDIRETSDLLHHRLAKRNVEILPLFSRLTAAEQQRVFDRRGRRRVVVATNIAETSLTIPGIRYVVDPGLARINRYNPRTHTQRLPIEAISRSSAEQRKGRCGRVAEGVCVRFYSEEEFLARPEYTAPEIQRSDLADIILRMLDLQLGKVEEFPFVDPPSPRAINSGYVQLQELGALDSGRRLTRLGRDMARLPIAPTVSRMILQAQAEGALPELLVIAAAIGIQDPRERPLSHRDEADRMHRQFVDRHSDFLTLLNIWNRYHERFEQLETQSQMRKFCRSHFLSFTRMREWRDIHAQLTEVLSELGGFRLQPGRRRAGYEAIHRSIVTGLLSSIARKKEHNLYRAARSRDVMLFPGSGLFVRREAAAGKDEREVQAEGASPEWIVAAEIVETSRLFARTAARIREGWLPDLGGHLCRSSYGDPYWSRSAGRVLVQETVHLHGLQIARRRVPGQQVKPREAAEVFIRDALVAGDVDSPREFLARNRQLADRIETWQTRTRRTAIDVDEAVRRFYASRLEEDFSSVHDLNRIVNARPDGDRFLHMEEADLLGASEASFDRDAFPDRIELDGEAIELAYAYEPGREEDGITVRLPYRLMDAINPELLDWLVPGVREERITCLLRSLPKQKRKQLLPIPQTARRIAAELEPTHPSLLESLEEHLADRYRLQVRRTDWKPEAIPEHLRLRVEVRGSDGQAVAAGRDLEQLSAKLQRHDTPVEQDAWRKAAARWERDDMTSWDCGDLPEQVEVSEVAGIPLLAYPGLLRRGEGVGLRLFRKRADAEQASRQGIVRLSELVLKEQMRQLRRDLAELRRLQPLCASFGGASELEQQAYTCLLRYLFGRQPAIPLSRESFEEGCRQGRRKLAGAAEKMVGLVETLLETRRRIITCPQPYPGMEEDLNRLLPPGFLSAADFERLPHLCRYLKGVFVRADRARGDAARDRRKAELVTTYQHALDELSSAADPANGERLRRIEEFRWLLEEWRISVFAQELGTAGKVSAQRVDKKLEEIRTV